MAEIIFNKEINAQLDKVIPFNPLTGIRDDIVHQYEIALTDSERANLEQYLQVQNVSNPSKQLSDKDLIALCPSRYVQTISDVKHLAQAMRSVVDSLDSADQAVEESSPESSTQSSSDISN